MKRDVISVTPTTKFGIAEPRILFCGLNLARGRRRSYGHEEIDTIAIPVFQFVGYAGDETQCGRYLLDTLFHPNISIMPTRCWRYHDQGLPVLKIPWIRLGRNITLRLTFLFELC
ncbi:4-hydroxythreonine-4-phosphate dehydrogenase PdxA [Salmonella enterica subsp. enterica]|nr:4-hydroxythreonine-4-phosphate dehydrogenase PdxA [Salmonella enterica subsp. enterica]